MLKEYIKNNKYWLLSVILCIIIGQIIYRVDPNFSIFLAAGIGLVIGIFSVLLDHINNKKNNETN